MRSLIENTEEKAKNTSLLSTISGRHWRGFQTARAARAFAYAPTEAKKLGASLYSGSNLLSIGFNDYRASHPNGKKYTLHAEHRCLLRRQYYTNRNLTLYIWRETADGKPACSRPCVHCRRLIIEAGVKRICFVGTDGRVRSEVL